VGLSLGSADGLDQAHLQRLKTLQERFEPALISDHLSWSLSGGHYTADLLPLPMTEEALDVMCRHVDQVQAVLKQPLLLENPSSYLTFNHSTLSEWAFLTAVVERTGCGLLCDLNNIYVSCHNHGWDVFHYMTGLPWAAVGEIHLAGHARRSLGETEILIDDHGSAVSAEVWALYRYVIATYGPRPTLIEWDTDIPALDILVAEAHTAQRHMDDRHVRVS